MPKKIYISLSTERLQLPEFTQCLSSSLNAIDKKKVSLGEDQRIISVLERIRKELPLLEKAIKQKRDKTISKQLREADNLRNQDIQALFDSIKPFKNSRLEEKKAAYDKLQELFSQYKEMKVANYEKETALVKSFLEKLSLAPYKAAVKTLACGEYIENLRQSQADFYQLFLNRANEKSQQVAPDTKLLRKSLQQDYKLLYDYLQNVLSFEPNSPYKELLVVLNEIRTEYATILARRSGRRKVKSKESA